jgi:fatty-acyl-CoA synthase
MRTRKYARRYAMTTFLSCSASTVPQDVSIPLLEVSVGDCLRETAARFAERPALLWAEGSGIGRLSYSQLLAESASIAHWILACAAPGDRIVIWSRNTIEWILLEYGCALAGTIITAWNPAWTDAECERARDLVDPCMIFAGVDVRGVDLLARASALGAAGTVHSLDALRSLASTAPTRELPTITPDDLFLLQFTSGTTGRPKAAALSHRASLNSAWLRARLFDADDNDVWLNPVPMTHVGGAIALLLGAMVSGGAYVLLNRFEAGEYIRLMSLCGATRIGGVPTMFTAALDHPDWRPGTRVRSIGLGGAQVPPALIERLRREFGAPVLSTYGQSECPLISTSLPRDDPRIATDTVGRAAPHVELKICDVLDGRQLDVGEVGEILVRSPTMMSGYLGMPDVSLAAFDPNGFLHTGDLGCIDAEGYLRIRGRARDVIIRGGENIYPAEVEDVLLRHPAVGMVGVVGVPSARWGQEVGAAVVLREGAAIDCRELEGFAATRLAHFKIPRHWRQEQCLPMTASGKVLKGEVQKMFLEPGA